jgi:hypothetical protein
MLASYQAVVGDLSPVQKKLLAKQLADLEKYVSVKYNCLASFESCNNIRLSMSCRHLQPGITPLNWNSLGIQEFIEQGNK